MLKITLPTTLLQTFFEIILHFQVITKSLTDPDENFMSISRVNPFTLKVPLESIVCHFHTFENNLGIKQKFIKYLKESCCLTSG